MEAFTLGENRISMLLSAFDKFTDMHDFPFTNGMQLGSSQYDHHSGLAFQGKELRFVGLIASVGMHNRSYIGCCKTFSGHISS